MQKKLLIGAAVFLFFAALAIAASLPAGVNAQGGYYFDGTNTPYADRPSSALGDLPDVMPQGFPTAVEGTPPAWPTSQPPPIAATPTRLPSMIPPAITLWPVTVTPQN
jgi:hypothetical protein